ncbi:MAG: hypothetical protein JWM11_6022 [Planctomycetaceae bacterium]|nr:hypothetical protein [Planctomycetaceae bacterium]
MRMTDIQVERFGVWRDLHLPLPQAGLNILYGPNEAGKSTLMRFVRAMLYGFSTGKPAPGQAQISAGRGAMDIEHEGRKYRIQRDYNPHTRGDVSVISLDARPAPSNLVELILNGVEEPIFEKVFAVGLREIQELGTLQDGEVADRIYGLTLGPDGQKLINSAERFRGHRSDLLDPETQTGRLTELFERHDKVTAELRNHDKKVRQHRELCRERARVETEITAYKQRQSSLQQELRGHSLLQRIYGPWKRVQDCEYELRDLKVVQDFPDQGVERLEKLEAALQSANASRAQVVGVARQSKSELAKLRLPAEYRAHSGSIQGLIDQRGWIRQVQDKIAAQQKEITPLQAELQKRLSVLGSSWTPQRLDSFDFSPAAHFRLVSAARTLRAALARRGKTQGRVKRLGAHCEEQADLIQQGQQLHQVDSIQGGLEATRIHLANLEELGKLKSQHAELQQRQLSLDEERERLETRLVLPPWVYFVLILFGISGLSLLGLGINSGIQLTQLVGGVFTLLIVTCGGICWSLKTHFEHETQQRLNQVNALTDANLRKIRDTHNTTRQLITPDLLALHAATGRTPDSFSEAELIQTLAHRSTELERLSQDEQRLNGRHGRLEQLQTQVLQRDREVAAARQNWQELLTHLGFAPNSSVDEAFETWKVVVEACELKRKFDAIHRDHHQQKWIVQAYEQRIADIGQRLHKVAVEPAKTWDFLKTWEQLLGSHAANRPERIRLKKDSRARMREAGEYQATAHDLKTKRSALLVQGGAADSEEFMTRAEQSARRIALLEEVNEARMELDRATGSDRDLAIAEEDLESYSPAQNASRIDSLKHNLMDLEKDMQKAFEQLGSLKHEIKLMETSRDSSRLRFEREQITAEIHETTSEWLATEVAGHGLSGLRAHFERTCQPVTLADASRHLERLTCGKYRNVWTPLGERQLRIDDEHNNTLTVEQLSRGTREQLFLSIRLALVEELGRQGTRLPMVLDDVLVNFDQERSDAATEVLRDFAEKGHQVLLFTCHRHLAEQAEAHGLEPIWLPGKETPGKEAKDIPAADRMAG